VNSLHVNSETGLIEADNRWSFKSEDKIKLIELAQECVNRSEAPRLKAICAKIGISTRTFWDHIDQDPEFKRMWDEIRFQVEDILENSLVNLGQKANGVGAAAFWLKNKVPERWSDNPGQNQSNFDISWFKKLADAMKLSAIDAVVVDNTGTSKAIDTSQ